MARMFKCLGSFIVLLFFMMPGYANHSPGLHVLLPDKTLDIQAKDVEESQVFQLDSKHSGVMLKLTTPAGARLTAATSALIGKDVLWVWDGRAIFIQKLIAPLGTDINILNLTTQEAEQVGKLGINH